MEIRAIAPNEWNYTYSQSMQITGQTGNIGHLRGDFDSGGYGFYTTWSDHRPQWKTDEFKTELDGYQYSAFQRIRSAPKPPCYERVCKAFPR